jgi:hypothetical protein
MLGTLPRLAAVASSSAARWTSRRMVDDRGRILGAAATQPSSRLARAREPGPDSAQRAHARRGRRVAREAVRNRGPRDQRPAIVATVPLAASQPIGVFDSGVSGLTILDECLAATLRHFGDTSCFPWRPRRRRRRRSWCWLVGVGVKLIVVLHTAPPSRSRPQRSLEVPSSG